MNLNGRYSQLPENLPLEDEEITSPDGTACEDLRIIHELMRKLGPDERRIIIDQAQGMVNGHPEYGEFVAERDATDRLIETYEEIRDGLNHIQMGIMKLRRKKQ